MKKEFVFLLFVTFIFSSFISAKPNLNGADIAVNFSEQIGKVPSYFYGVNTQGKFLSSGYQIDSDSDGILDSYGDYNWHRNAFLNSNMNYFRIGMSLGNYYYGVSNAGVEEWVTDSSFIDSFVENMPFSWNVNSYNNGVGYISKSTDSYSGNYSVNLSCNSGGHLYQYQNLGILTPGVYEFSVWIKTQDSVSLVFKRNEIDQNFTVVSGNGIWEKYSVSYEVLDQTLENWGIYIDGINPGESILWDDYSLTKNNQKFDFIRVGNLTQKIEQVKWADENEMKVLLIASYLPYWMADISVSGCDVSNLGTCSPKNNSLFGKIVGDFISEVSSKGLYSNILEVEVWNEPYGKHFLPLYDYDSPIKSTYYNAIYNATYNEIKSNYPEILVGGPSGYPDTRNAPNLLDNFLNDFPNKIDFISVHTYDVSSAFDYYDDLILNDTNYILNRCEFYNANCPRIIWSEWNVGDITLKNQSSRQKEYAMQIALAYASALNNFQNKLTMVNYQWSENKKYLPNINYPEYPQKWTMVSEPLLDYEFSPNYNITQNFATYHKKDSFILGTNYASGLSAISTSFENKNYITIINKQPFLLSNLNLSIYGISNASLIDLNTGISYEIFNNNANLGDIQEYGIRTFEIIISLEKDVNFDGQVNIIDLAIVIFNQGQDASNPDYAHLDLDKDGDIDWDDVKIILNVF